MYKCMKCENEMLSNSFLCSKCEYIIGRESDSHNTHFVRTPGLSQDNEKDYDVIQTDSDTHQDGSPYWNHAQFNNQKDEEGNIIENVYANTDVKAEISGELVLNGKGTKRWSKCALCKGRVFMMKRDGGVRKFVHDEGCWNVFKGQVLKEESING